MPPPHHAMNWQTRTPTSDPPTSPPLTGGAEASQPTAPQGQRDNDMTTTNNNTAHIVQFSITEQHIIDSVADANNPNAIAYWGEVAEHWVENPFGLVIKERQEKSILADGRMRWDYLPHTLTVERFVDGIRAMATQYPEDFARFMRKDFGCELCDTIIQCAAFGKLKYG